MSRTIFWSQVSRARNRKRSLAVEKLESRQLLALSITPLPASNITLRSATIGIEVSGTEGAEPPTILYWGDDNAGTDSRAWDHEIDLKTVGDGQHTVDLEGLDVGTTYYFRAFALSFVAGAVWTEVETFQTMPATLAQTEVDPSSIVSGTSALITGRLLDDGGDPPEISIFYGTIDGGDQVDSWQHRLSLGNVTDEFTATLSGLSPATRYSYRLGADNSSGISWSTTQTLTTVDVAPLRITEFMAENGTTAESRTRPSPDVDFPRTLKPYDWIEIYNAASEPINLGGYHLTDARQLPLKWRIPDGTIVAANHSIVVYASGENLLDPSLDEQGRLHTNFQLDSGGEYLALTDREGTVVHAYDDVPTQYRDVSYGVFGTAVGSFGRPTPDAANGPLAPMITNVSHEFLSPNDVNTAIAVTARVAKTAFPLVNVTLIYRAMYKDEISVAMADDGTGPDARAGDGIYSALIPGGLASARQMVRYRITAESENGLMRREPWFVDDEASPEYFGTIIPDSELSSRLPILHWFSETARRADTARGTRASVYYDGEFYDNAFIRLRGGTARNWPKKSYKLEFNDDHHFRIRAGVPRVDEINLNATYTDKSYLRARLTAEFQLDAGTPSPETFHLRIQQNGEFFSVAFLVEQPDRDFLRRHGLDPDGSLYKAGPGSTYRSTASFEKKTRDDEGRDDIAAFVSGLRLTGDELERFLFDNANLPAQINFMATNVIAQNIDASDKNHYIYRDTNGTAEWFMMPWDLDLVFGPDALNTDTILADQNARGGVYPNAVHPFLGSRAHPLHDGKINMFLDAVITTPRTREMLLRRVRSMADEFLATGYFHRRIDELVELIRDEVPPDRELWGNRAHFGSIRRSFEEEAERIKTEYLDHRLPYLTEYHVQGGVGIPESQPVGASLSFGDTVEFNPKSGVQGEEYFTIHNPNDFAVDVSGWQISGATAITLSVGTVIPASDHLYLTFDAATFRKRAEGPAGNQALFIQSYATELPNTGGTLVLADKDGRLITEKSFGAESLPASVNNLRITEINFNPHDALTSFGETLGGGSNFEFVELANISDVPIELAGVQLREAEVDGPTAGIQFRFRSQTLEPNERIVIVSNRAAFVSRYGSEIVIADGDDGLGGLPGEFANRLGNGGETLTLLDASHNVIQSFRYDDGEGWPRRADGAGSSLEVLDVNGDYNNSSNWKPSREFGGSPGAAGQDSTSAIVINEILSNSDAPLVDQIELFNQSDLPVDISGWYLTDSRNDPLKFQFPPDSIVEPQGFLVLSQLDLGFGFKNDEMDDAYLIETHPSGRPALFADSVDFEPSLTNVSIGRWPDGQGPLQTMQRPTFGEPNSGPADAQRGDFDNSGTIDVSDVDQLCASIKGEQHSLRFDLDGSSSIDQADLNVLIRDILKSSIGDANLDGQFDSADLVQIFRAGEYEDGVQRNSTWATGDWHCDGEFNSQDLVAAFRAGGYTSAAAVMRRSAVQEHVGISMFKMRAEASVPRFVPVTLRHTQPRSAEPKRMRQLDELTIDAVFGTTGSYESNLLKDELLWIRQDEQDRQDDLSSY